MAPLEVPTILATGTLDCRQRHLDQNLVIDQQKDVTSSVCVGCLERLLTSSTAFKNPE